MKKYSIDFKGCENFNDFIIRWNRNMFNSFEYEWNGNLDAFNDLLSWPENTYQIELINFEDAIKSLSYSENLKWNSEKLKKCHKSNIEKIEKEIENAKNKTGKVLIDIINEIILSQVNVEILLKCNKQIEQNE
jgi:hypothetical protein